MYDPFDFSTPHNPITRHCHIRTHAHESTCICIIELHAHVQTYPYVMIHNQHVNGCSKTIHGPSSTCYGAQCIRKKNIPRCLTEKPSQAADLEKTHILTDQGYRHWFFQKFPSYITKIANIRLHILNKWIIPESNESKHFIVPSHKHTICTISLSTRTLNTEACPNPSIYLNSQIQAYENEEQNRSNGTRYQWKSAGVNQQALRHIERGFLKYRQLEAHPQAGMGMGLQR